MSTFVPTPTTPQVAAIADTTYRNYDGELRNRSLRWWTIALATIRANVNYKRFGYWIPAGLILAVYFYFAINHYFSQVVREQMATQSTVNPYAVTLYTAIPATNILILIATMTVGAASISADNRANALLVYLSKPITRTDYLLGKWMGIFLLIAALTLIPSLLLFLFFATTYSSEGFLQNNPILILQILVVGLVAASIHTSLIIGFSAWSKSPRLTGAAYAAFYFLPWTISGTMGHLLLARDPENKQPQIAAVVTNFSVPGVIDGIGMNLYDTTAQESVSRLVGARWRRSKKKAASPGPKSKRPRFGAPESPDLPPMLLLGGVMIVLPLLAAQARIRAVEVIRG